MSATWSRGGGAIVAERVDEVAHAEIAQCRAEEDRRQMAFEEGLPVEGLAGLDRQRQLVDEGIALVLRQAMGRPSPDR